ncbi:hypothetical protein DAI22_07g094700 [Oryza sativa Japonica Group]|nr:hypothetical protein DAI22_07g094700 [Oryza sativa Japonica Group]
MNAADSSLLAAPPTPPSRGQYRACLWIMCILSAQDVCTRISRLELAISGDPEAKIIDCPFDCICGELKISS